MGCPRARYDSATLANNSFAWRSAGARMRTSEPGTCRARCKATTPAIVDLPDWQLQLRSTRGASERRSLSCQGSRSGSPTAVANLARSSSTTTRPAPRRAFSLSMSALSRAAVTTLQLLHLASEVLQLDGTQQGIEALQGDGRSALLYFV